MPTAVAPSATAFNTSDARRTPPSTKSWNLPSFSGKVIPRFSLKAFTTETRISIPEGAVSSCRPPWLESTTPAVPASYARSASSHRWTPFRMMGTRCGGIISISISDGWENSLLVMLLNQGMSFQLSEGSINDYSAFMSAFIATTRMNHHLH